MLANLYNTAKKTRLTWIKTLLLSTAVCTSAIGMSASASTITIAPDKGGMPVQDYLPDTVTYDPAIPTPESVLGANLGQWHVRHDQLVNYMYLLAHESRLKRADAIYETA